MHFSGLVIEPRGSYILDRIPFSWLSGHLKKKNKQIVDVFLFAAIRKLPSKWGYFHNREIIFVTFYCWIHK